MRLRGGGLFISVLAALLGAALTPAAAGAATVVNGGFETGSLSGWNEQHATEAGDWFAYRGTEPPLGPGRGVSAIPPPPQGRFAAITDERDPDTMTLWQDVALEPNATHVLSLQAFYESQKPLSVPFPDSLSTDPEAIGEQGNEQFRIDVMKPTAPLGSVAPEDILATVFQTAPGGPKQMGPTRFSANLTPFAGQTVRIRAVVVNRFDPIVQEAEREQLEKEHKGLPLEGVFNAGIDNVAITSAGAGIPGSGPKKGAGADRISFGHPRPNRENGTVILPVKVPAAGLVRAASTKKKKAVVLPAKKRVVGATTANLAIKPTKPTLALLARGHKLRIKVSITFNPDNGASEFRLVPIVLKLAAPKHHR